MPVDAVTSLDVDWGTESFIVVSAALPGAGAGAGTITPVAAGGDETVPLWGWVLTIVSTGISLVAA